MPHTFHIALPLTLILILTSCSNVADTITFILENEISTPISRASLNPLTFSKCFKSVERLALTWSSFTSGFLLLYNATLP